MDQGLDFEMEIKVLSFVEIFEMKILKQAICILKYVLFRYLKKIS